MARFVKGDVVVLPFPYSDMSASKRRPAVVIGVASDRDYILCQVTSQPVRDSDAIPLATTDLLHGALAQPSNIRPNYLFTARDTYIGYQLGKLRPEKIRSVVQAVIAIVDR